MQFNSYLFFVFFACVLAIHYSPIPWRGKKLNLLVASYLFYAAWNPPFVVLIWISTVADWYLARGIHRSDRTRRRRALVVMSLLVNLGLLGYFKYAEFVLVTLQSMLAAVGVVYTPPDLDIVLPVGISFYTFQTLSYTLDIYFRRAPPWRSFLDYALYVTFFPQLVAGPIVRSWQFLPQCAAQARASAEKLGWGLSLLVLGIFQKNVIADVLLAPAADPVFAAGVTGQTTWEAWTGTLAFAGQIFCDFAGYSTCAIGAALCLGFHLPTNFRFPYAALGFSDFWRRWHISLSSWLRDYLYIPLGGNRKGAARTHINLMLTMLIGGLWHGASWTFVVWGGLHGLYLIVERVVRKLAGEWRHARAAAVRAAAMLATFAAVCVAWVFFRAGSFDQALSLVTAMFGAGGAEAATQLTEYDGPIVWGAMVAMLAVHWCMRSTTLEAAVARASWWLRAVVIAVMLFLIIALPGQDRAFIYFQF